MAIGACELCGKPFKNLGIALCTDCSKIVEDTYIKARKYIYQNDKTSDFASIVEATEIPEKALSYLINKGRIMISNKNGSGIRCRACGKETTGGALCDVCSAKILAERLSSKSENTSSGNEKSAAETHVPERVVRGGGWSAKRSTVPISHGPQNDKK